MGVFRPVCVHLVCFEKVCVWCRAYTLPGFAFGNREVALFMGIAALAKKSSNAALNARCFVLFGGVCGSTYP